MRVLVAAPGGLGHVHPLLALATAFRGRGHEVRFAVSVDHCRALEELGFTAVACGLPARERFARMQEYAAAGDAGAAHSGRTHGDFGFPYGFGAVAMPAMLADLRPLAASYQPDLVVHDVAELASALVATELGVRRAAHSFGTTVPAHRLAKATELTAHLWEQAGLVPPPLAGVFDDVYVDIRPPSLEGHPPAGTNVLAERPSVVDVVGGRLPDAIAGDADDPLVYITLGTVFSSAPVLRMVVAATAELPVRVLVTVGPAGDPSALGELPSNVHVERYVPQGQVLPLSAAVVSHGGSGTLLGTLAHGLPQLCLPQGADQFINADAAAAAGASLTIEGDALSAEAVRTAVEQLLSVPSYRTAAQRIAAEIAAMPSADEVAAQLEQLAR